VSKVPAYIITISGLSGSKIQFTASSTNTTVLLPMLFTLSYAKAELVSIKSKKKSILLGWFNTSSKNSGLLPLILYNLGH